MQPTLKRVVNSKYKADAWYMTPTATFTYYSSWRNAVLIPAGRLQRPLHWNISTPAVKYGATGQMMGNYMYRAVDEHGKEYK